MSDTIYSLPGAVFYSELDNAPTGLVGTVAVRLLRKSDDVTVTARTTAGIVESPADSGRYKATMVAPNVEGAYTVFWDKGEVTPTTTATDDLVVTANLPELTGPSFPGYPSREELVDGSVNEILTEMTEKQQDALREAAIVAVEAYAGQSFQPLGTHLEPVAKVLAGTGATELYLPARLEELVELSMVGGAITAADVVISDDHDRIYLQRNSVSTWVERALSDTCQRVFLRGHDTITISGVWGWSECPDAVVQALRFDMEDAASAGSAELAPSLQAWRKMGLDSMAQGPLSVQLSGRPAVLSPRAADMLDAGGMVWADVGEVV